MEYEFKDYYFYSNTDVYKEPIGTCTAGTIGIAVMHFASMKAMSTENFIKLYSVGVKNEHK